MTRRAFIRLAAIAMCLVPAHSVGATEFFRGGAKDKSASLIDSANNLTADDQLKDYLLKVRNPDIPHRDDIVLGRDEQRHLAAVVQKLDRLCQTVGNGKFSTIGFDEALRATRKQPLIGVFTQDELAFMEMIYHREAGDYGFFGKKQVVELVHAIADKEIVKVPRSGNYLYKGASLEKYERIKSDLGEEVVLTSGIRGIIKQFHLFLGKAYRHGGNLSLASRSLAPPGYSYHATGDFDIGQNGLGDGNFSEKFTTTPVFKRLAEQGFVDYRYWRDNTFGVRYEPWHIKL